MAHVTRMTLETDLSTVNATMYQTLRKLQRQNNISEVKRRRLERKFKRRVIFRPLFTFTEKFTTANLGFQSIFFTNVSKS